MHEYLFHGTESAREFIVVLTRVQRTTLLWLVKAYIFHIKKIDSMLNEAYQIIHCNICVRGKKNTHLKSTNEKIFHQRISSQNLNSMKYFQFSSKFCCEWIQLKHNSPLTTYFVSSAKFIFKKIKHDVWRISLISVCKIK